MKKPVVKKDSMFHKKGDEIEVGESYFIDQLTSDVYADGYICISHGCYTCLNVEENGYLIGAHINFLTDHLSEDERRERFYDIKRQHLGRHLPNYTVTVESIEREEDIIPF